MKKRRFILSVVAVLFGVIISVYGQVATGGTYKLDQAVVASGGGTSNGTGYQVEGTSGQGAAGANPTGGTYSLKNGYWPPALSAPTAAGVSLSGRVLTADGRGLRNAFVILTDPQGGSRFYLTSAFGYYRFDEVPSGASYVISISSKRYLFTPRLIGVFDDITGIDLIANEIGPLTTPPIP